MLFLYHNVRTRLDLLKQSLAGVVSQVQDVQSAYRAAHSKVGPFSDGNPVLVRDYRKGGEKWTAGTVTLKAGPGSYSALHIFYQ